MQMAFFFLPVFMLIMVELPRTIIDSYSILNDSHTITSIDDDLFLP